VKDNITTIKRKEEIAMLETRVVKKGSPDVSKVENLIHAQFPKNERMPMTFLLPRAEKDFVDFLAFYDKGEFCGFTYLITNNGLTFIQYLAVDGTVQSKGYGSMILDQIKAQYPNNRIVLNLQIQDEHAANSEQRIRRRAFYAKNGYQDTGIISHVHGNTLDTLILGGTTTTEEFQVLLKKFTGFLLGFFVKWKLSYAENGGF